MKPQIRRFTGAALLLTVAIATPLAALAQTVDVIIWDFSRGGLDFHPIANPSLFFAIEDGVGGDLNLVMVDELTEESLAQADLAFLWDSFDGSTRIGPLSSDEQNALAAWNADGGSVFIALDRGDFGDALLGAPFGVHNVGVIFGDGTARITPNNNFLTDGPFGQPEQLRTGNPSWLDSELLLSGFVETAWHDNGGGKGDGEIFQGFYDWQTLGSDSGVVGVQLDSTFYNEPFWEESWGSIVSNFYAHALAGPASPGDLNCDGRVDATDIEGFLLALFDREGYAAQFPDCDINNGDINGDGSIDALDIEGFLGLLFP